MLCRQAAVAWLLLGAWHTVGQGAGECEGPTCAVGGDEAGLLQVKGPGSAGADSFLHPELKGEDVPEEVVKAIEMIEYTGDPKPAVLQMPASMRGPMDGLADQVHSAPVQVAPFPECTMSAATDCPRSSMSTTDPFTAVFPDPAVYHTSCLNLKSPFAFQVFPGNADKLLIYFQDGGACWDELSASMPYEGTRGICNEDLTPCPPTGIFNKEEEDNPFKDYLVVHINYCSGDAHAGNNVHYWVNTWMRQAGYNNSNAAVHWMLANADKHLKNLVIAGASAGSLGTQVWARTLLKLFKSGGRSYDHAAVFADSYLGNFPPGTQDIVYKDIFKVCSTPIGQNWKYPCGNGLTVQGAFSETMAMFPDVPFVLINSKADNIQSLFYAALSFTLQKRIVVLGPNLAYSMAAKVLHNYAQYPNFAVYQVDGDHHMFVPKARCKSGETDCSGDVYDARASGPLAGLNATSNTGNDKPLTDWLKTVINGGQVTSVCHGTPKTWTPWPLFPITGCDKALVNKVVKLAPPRAARGL
mmetsp:Transcript_17901/g.48716  ORF Transcript_17901/g.48716 Transcript_17901/m.48716 type:complete len:526 (-) Transcript_17901:113-1690(-)